MILGFSLNPYGDFMSLAMCKPTIRRVAQVGDYVVELKKKENCIYDESYKQNYVKHVLL